MAPLSLFGFGLETGGILLQSLHFDLRQEIMISQQKKNATT